MGNVAGKEECGECCDSRNLAKIQQVLDIQSYFRQGAAGGVGLIVAKVPEGPDQGRLVISQVMPFGAALKQTLLQKDDVIIKIDGIQTQLLQTHSGHPSPLCGPGNTTVTLQILRPSTDKVFIVTIIRSAYAFQEELLVAPWTGYSTKHPTGEKRDLGRVFHSKSEQLARNSLSTVENHPPLMPIRAPLPPPGQEKAASLPAPGLNSAFEPMIAIKEEDIRTFPRQGPEVLKGVREPNNSPHKKTISSWGQIVDCKAHPNHESMPAFTDVADTSKAGQRKAPPRGSVHSERADATSYREDAPFIRACAEGIVSSTAATPRTGVDPELRAKALRILGGVRMAPGPRAEADILALEEHGDHAKEIRTFLGAQKVSGGADENQGLVPRSSWGANRAGLVMRAGNVLVPSPSFNLDSKPCIGGIKNKTLMAHNQGSHSTGSTPRDSAGSTPRTITPRTITPRKVKSSDAVIDQVAFRPIAVAPAREPTASPPQAQPSVMVQDRRMEAEGTAMFGDRDNAGRLLRPAGQTLSKAGSSSGFKSYAMDKMLARKQEESSAPEDAFIVDAVIMRSGYMMG